MAKYVIRMSSSWTMLREIPRCKNLLPREEFFRLKNIHDKSPWLAYENVLGLYELWELTDCENHKEMLEFLISRFSYVDSEGVRDACKSIANQIQSVWALSSDNTIITAICDNTDPDGSQYVLQAMKNKFSANWRNSFYNAITNAVHKVGRGYNLVIIDDFIGTGNTVVRKVKYVRNTLEELGIEGVSIYVCSLAAMNFSGIVVADVVKNSYSYMYLHKGISELAPEVKRGTYTAAMHALEAHLYWSSKKRKRYSFGYDKSEALFSLETTNVPNNVFPIFWWPLLNPGVDRSTILRRL